MSPSLSLFSFTLFSSPSPSLSQVGTRLAALTDHLLLLSLPSRRPSSLDSNSRRSTNLAGQDEFRLDYDAGVLNQVATPGQVVVVYLGDWCLGSGIISEREWIFETPSRVGGERTTRTRSTEKKV